MILIATIALYVTASLCVARLIAGHLAWRMNERARLYDKEHYAIIHKPNEFLSPSGERWLGAWCLALLVVTVWPLVGIAWLCGRRVTVGAERAAQLKARDKRVRELERELGIK